MLVIIINYCWLEVYHTFYQLIKLSYLASHLFINPFSPIAKLGPYYASHFTTYQLINSLVPASKIVYLLISNKTSLSFLSLSEALKTDRPSQLEYPHIRFIVLFRLSRGAPILWPRGRPYDPRPAISKVYLCSARKFHML